MMKANGTNVSAITARQRTLTKRADFEAAWRVFAARRSEADFEGYCHPRASEAWKLAMWAAGYKLPSKTARGRARCFCGAQIDTADVPGDIAAAGKQRRSWVISAHATENR